jgi:light-harvesting protein B-800-850 alpha chain
MKEGRIFLYVSPNVLLPIMFLVMVLTSLSVHYSVLSNTTWMADFFQGSASAAQVVATETTAVAVEPAAPAVAETAPAQ